jgi:hypothetical protein
MNETGIVIKAGNVSIVGIKIETSSAAAFQTTSAGSTDSSSNVTAAAANLKTRSAAFNGTLGFYTLGVEVQVLGEFALQVRHIRYLFPVSNSQLMLGSTAAQQST